MEKNTVIEWRSLIFKHTALLNYIGALFSVNAVRKDNNSTVMLSVPKISYPRSFDRLEC